jgi:hypothetical protein
VKNLLKTFLPGLRLPAAIKRKKDSRPVFPDARGDDDRSSLLSMFGTALLSVACLIVLWLQWERTNCLEIQAAGGQCASDTRSDNTGGHRHAVNETADSKVR